MSLKLERARRAATAGDPKATIAAYLPLAASGVLPAKDWIALGDAADQVSDVALAERAYREARSRAPSSPAAVVGLANVYDQVGRRAEALELYGLARSLGADNAPFWVNYGVALTGIGDLVTAIEAYQLAIEREPGLAIARMNLGNALNMTGQFQAAHDALEAAHRSDPRSPLVAFNLGLSRLRLGDWHGGLPLYEHRLRLIASSFRSLDPALLAAPGQRILVTAEQGLGDSLMFARLLGHLSTLGHDVTLQVPRALERLMLKSMPEVKVRASEVADTTRFDLIVPLPSLPYLLCLTPTTVPPPMAYASPAPVASRARIAIVWRTGSLSVGNVRGRTVDLASLLEALPPAASVVSLQQDITPEERKLLAGFGAEHRQCADFYESAQALAECSHVVTVDTAMAHLAGGFGHRMAVLIPFFSDWRWALPGGKSPWYPMATVIRQDTPSDWRGALQALSGWPL